MDSVEDFANVKDFAAAYDTANDADSIDDAAAKDTSVIDRAKYFSGEEDASAANDVSSAKDFNATKEVCSVNACADDEDSGSVDMVNSAGYDEGVTDIILDFADDIVFSAVAFSADEDFPTVEDDGYFITNKDVASIDTAKDAASAESVAASVDASPAKYFTYAKESS